MQKDSTRPFRSLSALLALAILLLAGCGKGAGSTQTAQPAGHKTSGAAQRRAAAREALRAHPQQATLILDFVPNAVHAGIYVALEQGWYAQEGVQLHVVSPSATTETLQLIDAGRAQFGLADGSDVASLIAKGGDAKAVMAVGQRPFGGLIGLASEHLRSPAQLQGKTVGITGVPSDRAVLDTEVKDAGGNPAKVHVVTVGFNGPQALLAGRVAAFTGFIPDEGVQLGLGGHPIAAFPLDRWGGPSYPGLVVFATRRQIASNPALVQGFVAATVRGYEAVLADPKLGLKDLLKANPSLPAGPTEASLRAYLHLFTVPGVPFGRLRRRRLQAMSSWMVGSGLIARGVRPARYGTNRFLPSGRR